MLARGLPLPTRLALTLLDLCLLCGNRCLALADLPLPLLEQALTLRSQFDGGVDGRLTLDDGGDRDLAHVDLACPLRELLLRFDELPISALELREALLELCASGVEVHRLALEPVAFPDRGALAPLLELGLPAPNLLGSPREGRLASGELLLSPRHVGPHPLDLLDLAGTGAPVLHRREPAAFCAESPKPPTEAPLTQREFPFHPLELALANRDRSGPFPQRPLQFFEVLVGSKPLLIALKNLLRHRTSNVQALCGIGHREYDQAS